MKKRYGYALLIFLWMLVIFWFSSQVADDSQGLSDQIVLFLKNTLHISMNEQSLLWDTISFFIRKGAHMSEYAILAILIWLYGCEAHWTGGYGKAWLLSVIYACTDELHQMFVPGRSGQLQDVGIDALGACLGLALLWLLSRCLKRWRTSHHDKEYNEYEHSSSI